jgi:hypothetical protein
LPLFVIDLFLKVSLFLDYGVDFRFCYFFLFLQVGDLVVEFGKEGITPLGLKLQIFNLKLAKMLLVLAVQTNLKGLLKTRRFDLCGQLVNLRLELPVFLRTIAKLLVNQFFLLLQLLVLGVKLVILRRDLGTVLFLLRQLVLEKFYLLL